MRAALTLSLCMCVTMAFAAQAKKATDKKAEDPAAAMAKAITSSSRLTTATSKLNAEVSRAAKAYNRERARSLDAYLKVIDQELNEAMLKKQLDEANTLNQLKKKVEGLLADVEATPSTRADVEPVLTIAPDEQGTEKITPEKPAAEKMATEKAPDPIFPGVVRPARKTPPTPANDYQVMQLVQPEHRQIGNWQMKDGALFTPGSAYCNFFIPVTPPESYDLEMKVTRMNDSKSYLAVVVPFGDKGLWVIFDQNRKRSLVDYVGKEVTIDNLLPPGVEKTLLIKVRKDGITTFANGEGLFGWSGDAKEANASKAPASKPTYGGETCLQVLTNEKCSWKISSIEMKPPSKE